jgi:molybdopterin-guanine dinucleotide biosynthesis protein A
MIVRAPRRAWPFTAAIMTGGRSSRMGVPKAAMRLPDGRTMAERMRDTLTEVCHDIVFLGDPHGVTGHDRIDDLRADEGPLAAIESLLATDRAPQYLVVPCDLPLLPSALLLRLIEGDAEGMTCFDFAGERGVRPLPCRIAGSRIDEVRRRLDDGQRALHRLVDGLGLLATRVRLADRESELLLNVNTPEDFERAWRRLGGHPHDRPGPAGDERP